MTLEHFDVESLSITRATMIPTPGRDLIGEILPTLSIITPVIPRQSMGEQATRKAPIRAR